MRERVATSMTETEALKTSREGEVLGVGVPVVEGDDVGVGTDDSSGPSEQPATTISKAIALKARFIP